MSTNPVVDTHPLMVRRHLARHLRESERAARILADYLARGKTAAECRRDGELAAELAAGLVEYEVMGRKAGRG